MSKKVKCIECANSMDWDIPSAEYLNGRDFLQKALKETIVCGISNKTKSTNRCQYCKHYTRDNDGFRKKYREIYERDLEQALALVHTTS